APVAMGDGGDTAFTPWEGPGGALDTGDARIDRVQRAIDTSVLATRRATYGLLGLDPEDPRD
ncbi:acetoin utilization protein AcuC, partial [Nocardia nova]|nr:acetoin utilization protein AcuC [Nocardia nova]